MDTYDYLFVVYSMAYQPSRVMLCQIHLFSFFRRTVVVLSNP